MSALLDLLTGRDESVALDRGALEIAEVEFPRLDAGPSLALLDAHAVELGARLKPGTGGLSFLKIANRYLFHELGFHGNQEDYHNPRNSCLNEVLARRTGIPITLCVVYMEIARRLERPVRGIGLPGHFIVEYHDGEFSAYVDPFHRGRLLSPHECLEVSRQATGAAAAPDLSVLRPFGKRRILIRMLQNLRSIYLRRRSYQKALKVLNLLLEATPDSADEYHQRAAVHLHLQQLRAARSDFEAYLRLAPQAPDRQEVEKRLETLKRWQAQMN